MTCRASFPNAGAALGPVPPRWRSALSLSASDSEAEDRAGEAEERLVDLGVAFVRRTTSVMGSSWFVGGRGLSPAPRREADRHAFATAPARPCRGDRNG